MAVNDFPRKMCKLLYKKMKLFGGIEEIIYITSLNHLNIGDHFIYLGEKEFFRNKGIKIKAEFNDDRFFKEGFKKIISNLPIVIRGGGCFGDIWYNSYLILERIVRSYKDNKIIFMPQSIFFKNNKKLERAKKIFNKHKNITIFARDKISYHLARKYFKKAKIYFSPDSAFFLAGRLKPSKRIYFSKKFMKDRVLYLKRKDKEKRFNWVADRKEIITIDWINLDLLSIIRPNSKRLARKAIDSFYNKKLIITTRLHGAILASLLRRPYILMPNNYHKIESFYNSWLKEDPNAHLVKNEDEINKLIDKFY